MEGIFVKTSVKFSFVLHSSVMTALLLGSQLASAQALSQNVGAGSVIQLQVPTLSGQTNGPFSGMVIAGPGAGSTFSSFCVEKLEYFTYNADLYVQGVTTATSNAPGTYPSTSDPLSYETAWLFTQYSNNTYGQTAAVNNAMQQAFWYLENELPQSSLNSLALSYVGAANSAVTNGYTGYGNVRVMNIYSNANYSSHAQDQLVILNPVPEPASYALLLVGLGLLSVLASQRKAQS